MKEPYTMKELPIEDRPYEKCLKHGCEALTDAELLAVVLRTGVPGSTSVALAREILELSGNDRKITGIAELTLEDLMKIRGIGKVKAVQIMCIAELSRRIAKTRAREGLVFTKPESIADYYMEDLRYEPREHCIIMMLDTRNRLIAERRMSTGTVNASLISSREIFIEAVRCQAVHIILIHNHPSGNPAPSSEDILLTKRIQEAGLLIGIELLDHIIIGDRCYVSLREENLM